MELFDTQPTTALRMRPYQEKDAKEIIETLDKKATSACYCLATGGGKTVVASHVMSHFIKKGWKVLVLVHRGRLVTQMEETAELLGTEPQVVTAETKHKDVKSDAPLTVVMVETIYRRMLKALTTGDTESPYYKLVMEADLIVSDEAHRADFDKILSMATTARLMGLTATPFRREQKSKKDYKPMSAFYGKLIVSNATTKYLVDNKFLSTPIYYSYNEDSLAQLKQARGEFSTDSQRAVFEDATVFKGLINNYRKHINGQKTLVFTSSVDTARTVTDELNAEGISAEYIYDKTTHEDRKTILDGFANNDFKVLVNCSILTEGYDQADIEAVVLYRATTSLPLYLQMCGRGSRIALGKHKFTLLDFGGNIKRHGFWHDDREWGLDFAVKASKKETIPPVKSCPKCEFLMHTTVTECPDCGYHFLSKEEQAVEVELIRIGITEEKYHRLKETNVFDFKREVLLNSIEDIAEYCKVKGYKPHFGCRLLMQKAFAHYSTGDLKIDDFYFFYKGALRTFSQIMGYKNSWVGYAIMGYEELYESIYSELYS